MSAHKKPAQSIAEMLANKIEKNNPGQRAFLKGYVTYSKKEVAEIAEAKATEVATEVATNTTNKIIEEKVIPLIYRTAPDKLKKYLYSIKYQKYDYSEGYKYMQEHFDPLYNDSNVNKLNIKLGGCSGIRKDNFVGRSYDFLGNEIASFVVRTQASEGRFATIGTAYGIDGLTEDIANSAENAHGYLTLPFTTIDVMNEKGVVITINILNPGQYGKTTGTHYGEEGKTRICALMLPRYLADYAPSAKEAVRMIKEDLDVYAPLKNFNEEVHVMICDKQDSYVVEFIDNEAVVMSNTDSSADFGLPNGKCIMTNLYNYKWTGQYYAGYKGNTEAEIRSTWLTDFAMGLERHEILNNMYAGIDSVDKMWDAVKAVQYTKLYNKGTNPYWYSEFTSVTDTFGKLTIYNKAEDYEGIRDYAIEKYEQRSENEYWISATANVYNIKDRQMEIISHEEYSEKFKFDIDSENSMSEEEFVEQFDCNFEKTVNEDRFREYIATPDDDNETLNIIFGNFSFDE